VSEQCLTSPPTQCRLSGRQFHRSKDPTNSIKVLKEKKNKHKNTLNTIRTHTYKKHRKSLLYINTMGVTRGWLPQRAWLPSLNSGGAAAAVHPKIIQVDELNIEAVVINLMYKKCDRTKPD